jgi:hypothetical protein
MNMHHYLTICFTFLFVMLSNICRLCRLQPCLGVMSSNVCCEEEEEWVEPGHVLMQRP